MTAIGIKAPGGPEMLVSQLRPLPQAGTGEMLVAVAAAGVNRPDVMQREGKYPPPKGATDIPGLEIAGEVVGVGEGATRWKVGDRIMALVVGGGYAQYCAAHESHALPVPPSLTLVAAAAGPETFFTVWHNVFARGRLQSGETLLVHGGSSGIGTTAIQLAKAFGARVIATAAGSAPTPALTTGPKISSPRPRLRPAAGAPISFWIWSAATTSGAIMKPPRLTGASFRSPCRVVPRPRLTSAVSCSSGSPTRVRHCALAPSPTKLQSRTRSSRMSCRFRQTGRGGH